jgi:hypothetical protein
MFLRRWRDGDRGFGRGQGVGPRAAPHGGDDNGTGNRP